MGWGDYVTFQAWMRPRHYIHLHSSARKTRVYCGMRMCVGNTRTCVRPDEKHSSAQHDEAESRIPRFSECGRAISATSASRGISSCSKGHASLPLILIPSTNGERVSEGRDRLHPDDRSFPSCLSTHGDAKGRGSTFPISTADFRWKSRKVASCCANDLRMSLKEEGGESALDSVIMV